MAKEHELLSNIFKKKIAKIYHQQVQTPILLEKAKAFKKLRSQGNEFIM